MSKDPAFLFYSSDWLSGTQRMSAEQKGKYIDLLCDQHQNGRLREKDMLNICKTYDEDIFDKFKIDQDGLYYNSKLETETNRRKAYSESRRKNRTTKNSSINNISKTYDKHMETGTTNRTINKTKTKNNIPSLEDFLEYGFLIIKQLNLDSQDYDFALRAKYHAWKDNGWKNGFNNNIKNWKNSLNNTLPHLQPTKNKINEKRNYKEEQYKELKIK